MILSLALAATIAASTAQAAPTQVSFTEEMTSQCNVVKPKLRALESGDHFAIQLGGLLSVYNNAGEIFYETDAMELKWSASGPYLLGLDVETPSLGAVNATIIHPESGKQKEWTLDLGLSIAGFGWQEVGIHAAPRGPNAIDLLLIPRDTEGKGSVNDSLYVHVRDGDVVWSKRLERHGRAHRITNTQGLTVTAASDDGYRIVAGELIQKIPYPQTLSTPRRSSVSPPIQLEDDLWVVVIAGTTQAWLDEIRRVDSGWKVTGRHTISTTGRTGHLVGLEVVNWAPGPEGYGLILGIPAEPSTAMNMDGTSSSVLVPALTEMSDWGRESLVYVSDPEDSNRYGAHVFWSEHTTTAVFTPGVGVARLERAFKNYALGRNRAPCLVADGLRKVADGIDIRPDGRSYLVTYQNLTKLGNTKTQVIRHSFRGGEWISNESKSNNATPQRFFRLSDSLRATSVPQNYEIRGFEFTITQVLTFPRLPEPVAAE